MDVCIKKLIGIGALLGMLTAHSAYATPILSIAPNSTSAIVRTDGLAIISYTVTNNTNQPIDKLIITPNYKTSGRAEAVTLGTTNTCTATLAAQASCNFNIQILGANQPSFFQVTPQVCGYGGIFCSVPEKSQILQVSINAVKTPYAYFSVMSGSNINKLVPVNTATFQSGTPFSVAYTLQSAVAVSPDGTNVYTGEMNSDDATIVILTSGSNPQLIQTVSLGYFPYLDVITVSPDGKTIYVTASESPTLYRIDNIGGVYTPTLITLPNGDSASGLIFSPDGSKIFITSYATNAVYVMDPSSNTVVQTLTNTGTTCQFDAPGSAVVSPDGNTIYVANGFGSEGISVVQRNNDTTYSCGSRITSPSEQLAGMTISPNGQFIYVIGINSPQQLYVISTATNTQIASYTVPDGSSGITVTPDGNTLFISNDTSTLSYSYALAHGQPTGAINAINVGGGSQTQGNFVG